MPIDPLARANEPSEPAPIDVSRARADTPGCTGVAHLNNAGAALSPSAVTEAMIGHLRDEQRLGGYEAAAAAAERIDHVYETIAGLIGARRDEIALAENATRAWDMAFYGMRFTRGQRILTARAEYASNAIAYLQTAERTGVRIEVVDDDDAGQLDVADLARRMDDDVALVAITHVPTQGGLVNPVAAIAAVTRAAGVPFLLDACQSIGQLPVDVAALGVDMLSATGRKWLRAPRGTGFLYVSAAMLDRLDPPFLDLHSATWIEPDRYEIRPDARRFESWEADYAARIGLGVAVDYARDLGLDAIAARVGALAEDLRSRLTQLPGVAMHDRGERRCGIVTFTVDGVPAADVRAALSIAGVNTSVTGQVSAQYDMPRRGLPELVRASPHYYNTEDELDLLCRSLPRPSAPESAALPAPDHR